jgi:hypothetical protein
MPKRDDDDWEFIDPFKFMIGCFKMIFNLVKFSFEVFKFLFTRR